METPELLRIPSPRKLVALTELLRDDEDFRFPRIKLNRDKPRYELSEPTPDDRDNFETASTFTACIVVVRKNFYQSEEDKEAGKEPVEKRAMYVVRLGKITPELIYVSPTSLKNWKMFAKNVVTSGQYPHTVLCEFSAERVKSQKGYTWNKMKFAMARSLTKEELAYIEDLKIIIEARVRSYEDETDLDKYEDEALGKQHNAEDAVEAHSRKTRQDVDDDDDDKPAKPGSGRRKAKAADTEEKPKKASDDDDEEKPKSVKPGYPSLDDDDEDLEAVAEQPKPSTSAASLDDDDED